MVLVFSVFICVLALAFYRSKLIFAALIGEIWILFAGAYGHADYYQQKRAYDLVSYTTRPNEDPLWWMLQKIFKEMGVSYRVFLWITSLIALILIAKIVFEYTKNIAYVWALYLISPAILDVVQYNNFIGMAMVIYATQYLVRGNFCIKKFLVWIALATGICSYMIIYCLLVIIPYMNEVKILVASLIASAVIFVSKGMVYVIASRLMRAEKIAVYFGRDISTSTYIWLSIYIFIWVLLVTLMSSVIKRRPVQLATYNESKFSVYNVAEMILKVNLIMIVVIPMQSFSLEAARMYRNIFVLNYILLSFVRLRKDYELRSALIRGVSFIMIILYSYVYIYYWNRDTVFIPVLEQNVILNYLF